MAEKGKERKTGHSSDQWFKLKTKHQKNDKKHQAEIARTMETNK